MASDGFERNQTVSVRTESHRTASDGSERHPDGVIWP